MSGHSLLENVSGGPELGWVIVRLDAGWVIGRSWVVFTAVGVLTRHRSFCWWLPTFPKVKVKWSRYRPGVAQRVGRGIALLFHDRGTRRWWVVSSTRRPFTPGKDTVPILQEAGWAPGPVWAEGKYHSDRDLIPDRPARSQSLYRMSYRAAALVHKGITLQTVYNPVYN